jgi:putative ABC transport system permease protein
MSGPKLISSTPMSLPGSRPGGIRANLFADRLHWHATIHLAFRALGRNKMRTVLTMLGITIGIGAVICTVAIGQGGSSMIHDQLEGLGTNMVWIEAGTRNVNGVQTGNMQTMSLKVDDAMAIQESVPLVASVAPNVDGPMQIVYGNQNWSTHYRGVSPEYFNIRRWHVYLGVLFTQPDVDHMTNVCLLGKTVVDMLFGTDDPMGKTLRLQNQPFQVIGVMEPKGLSSNGFDQDDFVIIPYTTAMKKLAGIYWLDDIYASAISAQAIAPAVDQISELLRQRHHLRPDEADDFNIRHPEDTLKAQENASHTFTLMLASIASVSLLIGGIGIMNIMLVSVTERTREIGVRMAVGATEQDVRMQFLIEALALSLLGGAVGVVVGMAASAGVSKLLHWPSIITPVAILAAVLFSVAIGVFFGYYPALKASQLDPIQALRFE